MSKFNNTRLRNARLYRRYPVKDFAKLLNVSTQTIMLYEKASIPPPDNMVKIAEILNIPIFHFFNNSDYDNYSNNTYYRKDVIVKKGELAVQKWKTNLIKQIYDFLSNYFVFPELNINKLSFKTPKDAAISLRKAWGLGYEPITDMKAIVESNGIIITPSDIQDAYCSPVSKNILIAVSAKSNEIEFNFNVAHELGHILYHSWKGANVYDADFKVKENEANEFASEFLCPTESLTKELVYPKQLSYYYILKERWKISVQVLLTKALRNNLINQSQYISLLKNIDKKHATDCTYSISEGLLQKGLTTLKDDIGIPCLKSRLSEFGIDIYFDEIAKLLYLNESFFEDEKQKVQNIILKSLDKD